MTEKEAMRIALEALEEINKLSVGENAIFLPAEIDGAMDALRQALEQPADKPMAWIYDFLNPDNRDEVIRNWTTQDYSDIEREKGFNVRPLYTRPQKAAQCEYIRHTKDGTHWCALAEQPATWVGLTEDEGDDIWNRYCDEMGLASINEAQDIVNAIEQALREKNHVLR